MFVMVDLIRGNDRLEPKGALVLACLKQQLCARNFWTSAQGYLAINWRGEVRLVVKVAMLRNADTEHEQFSLLTAIEIFQVI